MLDDISYKFEQLDFESMMYIVHFNNMQRILYGSWYFFRKN